MKDQMGRQVTIPNKISRIVSLVPSQTELLSYLGLDDQLVGITKFCIHPEHIFRSKTRIGGTKQLKLEQIAALQPDLIIGNKEENEKRQIEALMADFPVWMSDIKTLEDSFQMIEMLGTAVNRSNEAAQLVIDLQTKFTNLKELLIGESRKQVAYFIWRDPWMVAGRETFIDSMLEVGGMDNVFKDRPRYPEVQLEELAELGLDAILLSSEPYPFKEKHIDELKAVCGCSVALVDGELFSWYGPRLFGSVEEILRVRELC